MKFNKWTLGLAAVGVVSLASAARADETNLVTTALSSTTISGYVDTSASFAPNGGGGTPNYYYGSPVNSINLNVVDIALDKPLDESPWAAGYHAELWFGPNAAALGTATTFNTVYNYNGQPIGTANSNSQAAIRQAYVTLLTPVGNGITWKLGIWDTIVGYESTTTGNNPNYTHSYGYNMEPTTHTGLLGAYKINDIASVQAGVADTSYQGAGVYTASSPNAGQPNNGLYHPTWLGGVTLTAPDSFGWAKGATLSVDAIITGGNTTSNFGGNGSAGQTYYAGVSLPTPIAALKFGAAFDYLNAADASEHAWDIGVYSTYQFNDKLSLNLRAEYYNGAPLNTGEYQQGGGFGTGFGGQENAQEVTATVQYALWANVLTRLEFRVDNVNHGNGYSNVNGGGYREQAFLLAAQAVYTF
jgi:hypothetical protein